MIGKHFFVVGVLCALIPAPTSAEEIEVVSCDPWDVEIGQGAELVCMSQPEWMDEEVEPDDPFDGPEGNEYQKGGKPKKTKKKKGEKVGGGNPNGSAEAKRKARCAACKTSKNQCVSQAQSAELNCQQAARERAAWRCNVFEQHGPGKTPWGCTTHDIYDGRCPGVEAPWNDKNKWEPGGENTSWNCEESWRLPHLAGTVSTSDTSGYSVSFKGVGASNESTVNSTYQLSGARGWLGACLAVGGELQDGCLGAANKCFSDNGCGPEDQ